VFLCRWGQIVREQPVFELVAADVHWTSAFDGFES